MMHFVELESAGRTLRGMMHLPAAAGPHPCAMFCHGLTGMRDEAHFLFVTLARDLESRGIASLRFDFAGSGESDGAFEEMTASGEVADAEAALDFLRRHPAIDAARVAVVGLSLGGCVASLLAGRRGSDLRAVVLLAAVAETPSIVSAILSTNNRGVQLATRGYVDLGGLKLSRAFVDDFGKLDPAGAVTAYAGPVLVVHGTADQAVPARQAQRFRDVRQDNPAETVLEILSGADHTFTTVEHTETVRRCVGGFLQRCL